MLQPLVSPFQPLLAGHEGGHIPVEQIPPVANLIGGLHTREEAPEQLSILRCGDVGELVTVTNKERAAEV